ncbi:MAG: DUF5698 domain-containing protein [Eubacteriales bacterium]
MDFLSGSNILIYFFIFFGKILEVTLSTIRIVLINRGEKLKGSLIAFIEIIIWLLIINSVLKTINEDIIKFILYALAYAAGNYLGVLIEEKLAIGLSSIQVILPLNKAGAACQMLREHHFGVTTIEGEGVKDKRDILIIHLKRKRINEAVKLIQYHVENAVITINDVKAIRGGFIKK